MTITDLISNYLSVPLYEYTALATRRATESRGVTRYVRVHVLDLVGWIPTRILHHYSCTYLGTVDL